LKYCVKALKSNLVFQHHKFRTLPEIRNNAITFVHDWKGESRERAESQTFWNEFLNIFGIKRRQVAVFEKAVKKNKGKAS